MEKYIKNVICGLLCIFFSANALAYDFEVDGMYYNILSNNSVEITRNNSEPYSGELIIPNSVEYNGKVYDVVSIGNRAFSGCSGLTGSLIIPSSIISIGDDAFYKCSGLTGSLTIPSSVTSIGTYAFGACSGFTGSLTIPSSVTGIGNGAFYGCSGFTGSLTIPNSVISIGKYVFSGCNGFELVISKILSPFDISGDVFSNLSAVLQVPKGTKSKYQALSGWNNSFKEIREEREGTHV